MAQSPSQVENKFHLNELWLIKSYKILGNISAPRQRTRWKRQGRVFPSEGFPFPQIRLLPSDKRSFSTGQFRIFIHKKSSWTMDKLRAMQTPSWFLQLLSRSSVFTRCKVRKYLWPARFGPCLFFLSSPFPVTFLPCFPWAPCKPLWLTTALKSNTVQSVPEEGGTPGVAAALGNFAP